MYRRSSEEASDRLTRPLTVEDLSDRRFLRLLKRNLTDRRSSEEASATALTDNSSDF
ncbi:hypothetical protein C2857_006693 [Epichloe festucae Fl1]|uniref:Uncharacterized protein n=1 Tax=Epichloe festucae (strain Fl1) TaxID=877507 RepID=A0A7S9PSS5_EPIFF|nr:hypothetical protein C2857_006693 [Epichloe festucae Fl1]